MEKKTGGRAHHAHALASNSTGGGAEEPRGREPRASAPPPTEARRDCTPPLPPQEGARPRPPRLDPVIRGGVGEAAPTWIDTEEEGRGRASAPSPAEADRGRPRREGHASRAAEAKGRGLTGGSERPRGVREVGVADAKKEVASGEGAASSPPPRKHGDPLQAQGRSKRLQRKRRQRDREEP